MGRRYQSPLRAEQMGRTRDKLVQAGIDLVAEAGGEELTIRRVAARAKVSVPTAYRHFPDPDQLLDAMAVWISARIIGAGGVPSDAAELPGWLRHIYQQFELNDRLVRAQLATPAGRTLRAKHQKLRMVKIRETMERSLPSLTPTTRHRLTALIQLLANLPAWISLHDTWGLSGADAGNTTAWAVELILAEARRRPDALDFADPPASAKRKRGRTSA